MMNSLFKYITENFIKEKFERTASSVEELWMVIKQTKTIESGKEIIKKFLNRVLTEYGEALGDPFVYDPNSPYFKIKYDYTDILKKVCSEFEDIDYEDKGIHKIYLKYKGSKFAETGSGSIGRVNTESQETATCVVFNTIIDELKRNPEFKFNYEFIKEIIKDISTEFDKEWVVSFYQQIIGIMGYIRKYDDDVTRYRMERYGGSKNHPEWKVSKVYERFITNYTHCFPHSKKDNWDPSDVILFREDLEDSLISTFNEFAQQTKDEISAFEVKKKMIDEFYSEGNIVFKGISLKKISGKKNPEVDTYNIGESNKVSNIKVDKKSIKETPSGIKIIVDGKFNFDDIMTETGDDLNKENKILLTMRSFGGSQVGIDVMLVKNGRTDPSLGKCPVSVWRRLCDIPVGTHIRDSIEKFKEYILDDKNIDGVRDIILSAIKNGPNCLPFILLH